MINIEKILLFLDENQIEYEFNGDREVVINDIENNITVVGNPAKRCIKC